MERRATAGRRALCGAVLVLVGLLALGACGGGAPTAPRADPAETPTAPVSDPAETPTAPGSPPADPPEAPTGSAAPAPVAALCAPYVEMVRSLKRIDYRESDDRIAAAMAPVIERWAAQVPGLERPPGLADDVWAGLLLLAERIEALPEEPSLAELEDVERDLTPPERRLIGTASEWFTGNCSLAERQ